MTTRGVGTDLVAHPLGGKCHDQSEFFLLAARTEATRVFHDSIVNGYMITRAVFARNPIGIKRNEGWTTRTLPVAFHFGLPRRGFRNICLVVDSN
jgi:hypothetical protein